MRTFLIIFAILAVLVISYFVYADYKSRKEAEQIKTNGTGEEKTAMYWVQSLFPVIFGSGKAMIRKKKKPEDKKDFVGPPTYEDFIKEGNLGKVA